MTGDTYRRTMELEIGKVADGNMGSPALNEVLEALVDRFDMRIVVECLSVVASDKADHLRNNWQDENAGRRWDRVAYMLDKATEEAIGVS